jgi:hypothetical protein
MSLKEIALKLPNKPGTLAAVARLLARERMNLAAISVDSSSKSGYVRIVVNDPEAAVQLLEKSGYTPEMHELLAIHLEDRAGSFLSVLEKLAEEKINVRGVVILIAREGNQSLVGLRTDDLPKARKVLARSRHISAGAARIITNADLLASAPTIPGESVGLLL